MDHPSIYEPYFVNSADWDLYSRDLNIWTRRAADILHDFRAGRDTATILSPCFRLLKALNDCWPYIVSYLVPRSDWFLISSL